jgi:ABC-type multidrug transport system permease subunit
MVNKTILYAHRCLKQTFRNAERFSVIFIIPILFLLGMALLYGDESSFVIVGETGSEFTIGVINQDQPLQLLPDVRDNFQAYIDETNLNGDPLTDGFGNGLIKNINNSKMLLAEEDKRSFDVISYHDIEEASKAVQSRFITMCFIIPSDFSETMLTGLNHKINSTENVSYLPGDEYYFSSSRIELIGDFSYARFSEAVILLEEMLATYTEAFWISGINLGINLAVEEKPVSSLGFNEFEIFVPALIVFILITSATGVAGIVGYEREQGTIDRLQISNFQVISFLTGLTLTQIITTALTIISALVTILFLGFPVQGNYQGIFIFLISIYAVIPLIGISLGFAAITDGQMSTYMPSMIAIPMAFLTGNFIPLPRLNLLGDIQVWHINPFFSVGEALRKIMIHNSPIDTFVIDLIMLGIIGICIYSIGALVFIKRAYEA